MNADDCDVFRCPKCFRRLSDPSVCDFCGWDADPESTEDPQGANAPLLWPEAPRPGVGGGAGAAN